MNDLPLMKSEKAIAKETGSASIAPSTVTGVPGVIKGITIKGNIGGSENRNEEDISN